jgi:hypothetical protein
MSSASPNYRRVSSQETDHNNIIHTRPPPADRLQDKLIALVWVCVAIAVGHFSNFWHVILLRSDSRASRPLLYAAAFCIATNAILTMYLLLYLPYCKGLNDASAWEAYCPRVIPGMILIGVLTILLLIRGCWPVWGCLAPLILGTQAMGAVFALHFVPWPF